MMAASPDSDRMVLATDSALSLWRPCMTTRAPSAASATAIAAPMPLLDPATRVRRPAIPSSICAPPLPRPPELGLTVFSQNYYTQCKYRLCCNLAQSAADDRAG